LKHLQIKVGIDTPILLLFGINEDRITGNKYTVFE